MMIPVEFLKIVGQVVLDSSQDSVFNDLSIKLTPNMADEIWKRWDAKSPDRTHKRQQLQALAQASYNELDQAIEDVEKVCGLKSYDELSQLLSSYLHLIPSMIRRNFRRPSKPKGHFFPPSLSLEQPGHLLPLLPHRLSRFSAG